MKSSFATFILPLLFLVAIFTASNAQTGWTKYEENPVLNPGTSGEWDDGAIGPFCIVFEDTIYRLWYSGYDGSNWTVGYATSQDGLTWIKYNDPATTDPPYAHSDPVLMPSRDDDGILNPSVLYDDGMYKMWYSGDDGGKSVIGYATSEDGITWTKYENNPVLNSGAVGSWNEGGVSQPCVRFDGSTYRMWFGGWPVPDYPSSIGYATSTDGINWDVHPDNPVFETSTSGWDSQHVEWPEVHFDGYIYHMWYTSRNTNSWWQWRIGYAYSTDGISWERDDSNPVLTADDGKWDSQWVGRSQVMWADSSLKMWYMGGNSDWDSHVGFATAPLIINGPGDWEKHGQVLYAGIDGSWDDNEVYAPCVIKDGDTLKMWYTGAKSAGADQIGYATSTDGLSWQKYSGNPVLPVGDENSWDSKWVVHSEVVFDGTTYHMWYGGSRSPTWYNFDVGYATSPDGINWTKYDDPATTEAPYDQSDPVLIRGESGAWDDATFAGVCCIFDGETFHMWYSACDGTEWANARIGYASSADGIHWDKHAKNPVFSGTGTWDKRVFVPSVIAEATGYQMWYVGRGASLDMIGYATSNDGITWDARSTSVFAPGKPGNWDDNWVGHPSVLFDSPNYRMWYAGGRSNTATTIGYATTVVTDLEDNVTRVYPDGFVLHQNYPNPFNPVTTIRYDVKTFHGKSPQINLSIYNLLGQKVATLVDKKQPAGNYQVQWDASGFASGIYYYQLKTEDNAQTCKMVLIR